MKTRLNSTDDSKLEKRLAISGIKIVSLIAVVITTVALSTNNGINKAHAKQEDTLKKQTHAQWQNDIAQELAIDIPILSPSLTKTPHNNCDVQFTVTKHGNITHIKTLPPCDTELFKDASIATLKNKKLPPRIVNGKATTIIGVVKPFNFEIQSAKLNHSTYSVR